VPSLRISARFNGPVGSANGGYVCGLLAQHRTGPTLVRLHRPPRLDVPLDLTCDADRVELRDGEDLVAHAVACEPLAPPPPAPTLAHARAARAEYRGVEHPAFAHCFVCSRIRADGLHVHAGPVEGEPLVACDWTPAAEFLRDGIVDTPILWAALDCPSFFGLRLPFDRAYLLGEMRAEFPAPVRGDQPLVVYAWARSVQGRKMLAGSALADAQGRCLGHAEHVWIGLSGAPA